MEDVRVILGLADWYFDRPKNGFLRYFSKSVLLENHCKAEIFQKGVKIWNRKAARKR